ncbi:MAG: Ku protein, partial [Erythrobacter sp.]
ALRKLIDKKAKSKSGKAVIEDTDTGSGTGGSNVVDLMAALKKSVGSDGGGRKTASGSGRRKKSA